MFRLGEEQPAFDKHASNMRQQRQHQFVNKIVLANNLLRQPVFQVREGLIVHGSGLSYCCVRNSTIPNHYKT